MLKTFVSATALVVFGTVVALLLSEFGLRVAYEYLPGGIQDMVRDVRVWGASGRKLGPSWFDYCVADDYLSARNLPNLKREPVQFGPAHYHLSTTSAGFEGLGFRTPEAVGPVDGVVVGDSFAFCHHVEIEDCWVSQVAAETGVTLANLAVPATGSVSHSRYLERYGRKLAPRFVIWQYWVNDPREDYEFAIANYRPCPRAVETRGERAYGVRQWLKQGSVTANLVYGTWNRRQAAPANTRPRNDVYVFNTTGGRSLFAWRGESAVRHPELAASGFELTRGALALAARGSSARNTAFLLLIAPSNLQVYADSLPNDELREEMLMENRTTDRLIEFAVENDIAYLDLRAPFIEAAAAGEDLYPDYDVHWTARGNKLAADIVAGWLRTNVALNGEPEEP